MKRKLIVLIAAVLAVCCMAGLLSGCSVIVRNVEYIDLAGQGASVEYSFVDESLESERLYPVSKGGTMYFVSADGDDLNDGLTPETPIKTLSKASSLSLKAGDSVLFRKGDTFVGNLRYSDLEGSKENPITIASYGEGDNRPIFTNGNETLRGGDIVGIYNSRGVVVRDLKIDAYASSAAYSETVVTGITYSYGKTIVEPNLDIYIVNNVVRGHDITGEYPDSDSNIYGITGSVYAGNTPDYAIGMYILKNEVSYVGRVGIRTTGGYNRNDDDENTYTETCRRSYRGAHLDGNTVHHIGQIGMYVIGGTDSTMDRNLVYQTCIATKRGGFDGQCGIMFYQSEHSSARYNVIYDVFDVGTSVDGMGIDIDWYCDHITLEYNYVYNCKGDGIGTMANSNSTIAHNRLDANLGASNHTGSIVLSNLVQPGFSARAVTDCHIFDNLIIQTEKNIPAFRTIHEGGLTNYSGSEFVGNHIVLKSETDVSNYYWIRINTPLQWYKFAENKFYSTSPDSPFRVFDKTVKNNLNADEGAQVYKAGAGSQFSSWQKRDLGSTYEMRSDDAPSKVENVTCTYENGKLLLNIAGDMSDVWHYNIYKVGFNESASYLNMIGQTESNTFEYDVPYTGEFFIIVQPESNQGIYGEGMKIRVNIGNKKGYSDLAGKEASAVYAFTDKNLGEEQLYPVSKGGTVYYVSAEGDDANDGITPETPIKTLSKASSLSLKAGDSVLFRKGDTFVGNLHYSNLEGSKENPITIASYGEGDNRPIFTNGNETLRGGDIVGIYNSRGVVVRDFKIEAYASSSAHGSPAVRGIAYEYKKAIDNPNLDIYIVNNIIRGHDITGEYPDTDSYIYGITGYVWANRTLDYATDIYILNNDVSYVGLNGIQMRGDYSQDSDDDDTYSKNIRKCYKGVHLDGNTVHHIGQIGMYICGGKNCTMDRNLVYQTSIVKERAFMDGQCGMMYIKSEYSSARYNIIYDAYDAGAGIDGMGFDIDWKTDYITLEYNYISNCLGSGIGTLSNLNSTIAHNRLEGNIGATNHAGSLTLGNLGGDVFGAHIYDNLIYQTTKSAPAFRAFHEGGNKKFTGCEFVGNHIVLKADVDPSTYFWVNINSSVQFYKIAENKYYSVSPDTSFKASDRTAKKYLNFEEGAQVYKAGAGSPFSSWQKRDLGSTYEMRSDNAPSKVENVTCTYENGKLLLNIAGDMSDVWHYNIYKVGYDESASYLNMIGQTESNTFEYEVPHNGEFYIIVQPESNQGIYGEGFKIQISIG